MMDARLGYLFLGCAIGFVLGYIARSIREVKERIDEVDSHVLHKDIEEDDQGFLTTKTMMNVGLLIVILLTVWASFASQRASNQVEKNQNALNRQADCTVVFLNDTIVALNERTTYTQAGVSANVKLQQAFSLVISGILHQPPLGEEEARRVIETYANVLKEFIDVSGKTQQKAQQNPFPTSKQLRACLKAN